MKRIILVSALIAGSASLALAADMPVATKAPILKAAAPSLGPSGYVGIYGGYELNEFSYNTAHDEVGFGGAEARVNYWYNPGFSVQYDIQGEAAGSYSNSSAGDHKYRLEGTVGVHLLSRNPNSGALGIFGALSGNKNLAEGGVHPAPMSHWWAGVEGQAYLGKFTLYGQAGMGDWIGGSSGDGALGNMWFARGVTRYFITPNSMVSAEVMYLTGVDVTDTERHINWSWGAKYEQGVQGSLWSWYLEYAGFHLQNDQGTTRYSSNNHQFLIGLRSYFGQGTLQANDRSGASFDIPKFTRQLAHSYNVY